jgi:hypothetical protein
MAYRRTQRKVRQERVDWRNRRIDWLTIATLLSALAALITAVRGG